MRPDFFTASDEGRLLSAARGWLGTPFRQRSCVKGKGGGVDCVCFVSCVFVEVGAIDAPIIPPAYQINHATHSDESLLLDWFRSPEVLRRVRRLDEEEAPVPGDLVFIKTARGVHHLGMQIGGSVFHVLIPGGVVETSTSTPGFRESVVARYRLTK